MRRLAAAAGLTAALALVLLACVGWSRRRKACDSVAREGDDS